jgi:hypothetical protein
LANHIVNKDYDRILSLPFFPRKPGQLFRSMGKAQAELRAHWVENIYAGEKQSLPEAVQYVRRVYPAGKYLRGAAARRLPKGNYTNSFEESASGKSPGSDYDSSIKLLENQEIAAAKKLITNSYSNLDESWEERVGQVDWWMEEFPVRNHEIYEYFLKDQMWPTISETAIMAVSNKSGQATILTGNLKGFEDFIKEENYVIGTNLSEEELILLFLNFYINKSHHIVRKSDDIYPMVDLDGKKT